MSKLGDSDPGTGSETSESANSANSNSCSETSSLEYEQESFETFRWKVVQLCIDTGLGTPSEVERMTGGSFNRIVGVAFADPNGQTSRYIIRIPRMPFDPRSVQDIKDQVAVLLYLSKYLPVAKVIAYDSSMENAIKAQFVIQERLPGQPIEAIYDNLSLEERLQLATAISELVQSIDAVCIPQFGRLIQSAPIPEFSGDMSQSPSNEIRVAGYRMNISRDMPTTNEDSLPSLLRVMCKSHFERVDDANERAKGCWRKFQEIITEMESAGLLSNTKEEVRLGHWDLSVRNVLVDKVDDVWSVSGVVDWDDAMSVPRVIGRKPPVWLWLPGIRVEEADTTPIVALTDEQNLIKQKFDEAMVASIPSFLDDAYHRGRWIRRLWAFAISGFTDSQEFPSFKLLAQDWDKYYGETKDVDHN